MRGMSPPSLLAELKRRRVFRVAAAYAVIAWLVIQIADTTFPHLDLPGWMITAVIVLALLGFPVALVLAWAFDITPEGVVRTEAAPEAGEAGAVIQGTPRLSRASRLAVVGAAIVLGLAGGAFAMVRVGSDLETNRVVVDVFTNRTGDPQLDVVGMMAADWLVEALQGAGTLQVVPLTATVDAITAFEAETRTSRADRASTLAAEFKARIIVSGSFYLESDSLRFVAEVTDARRRKLLHTTPVLTASRNMPSQGLTGLREQVLRFLAMWGGEADLGNELITASLAVQPSLEAYREWAVGNELFTRGEFREAQPYFARAVELDSTFTRAIGRAILSHTNVGEFEAAEPYVRLLLSLRDRMTPYERVAAHWVHAVHSGDDQRQYQAARQLATMVPAPLWLYVSGSAAIRVNRPAEAVADFARVDPTGGYAARWRPFWGRYSTAHHMLGEHRHELKVTRQGRSHHPDFAPFIEQELVALSALGRTGEVLRRLDELLTADDPVGAVHVVAAELDVHGHREDARAAAERALSWADPRPAGSAASPRAQRSHAAVLALLGRDVEARAVLKQVVAEWPADLSARGELGVIAARLGDRDAAGEAFAWLDGLDPGQVRGRQRYLQAGIAAELGEHTRAVTLLREAFAQGQGFAVDLHRNPHFRRLRGDAAFRELLRPKG
jgi:tetratricopeptide (TPR) repeat protein